jgi:AraC-like DNA-binding protein
VLGVEEEGAIGPLRSRIVVQAQDSPLGTWRYWMMAPRPEHAAAVELFWAVEGTQMYSREKILPSGRVDLLINLGRPHWRLDPANPLRNREYTSAWVSGLQESYVVVESPDDPQMMGVRLLPLGAHAFFGVPMHELTDQVFDLEPVLGPGILGLRDRLGETRSVIDRLLVLERFVADGLARGARADAGVAWAAREIDRCHGNVRIEDIRRELGVSRKRLVELFRRQVGLPPKVLARIRRFQTVVDAIPRPAWVDWSDMALDCGYYDQSHLIRDLRAFAGVTPTEFVAARVPGGGLRVS